MSIGTNIDDIDAHPLVREGYHQPRQDVYGNLAPDVGCHGFLPHSVPLPYIPSVKITHENVLLDRQTAGQVLEALDQAYQFAEAHDIANAAANGQEVRYRPLTQSLSLAWEAVQRAVGGVG